MWPIGIAAIHSLLHLCFIIIASIYSLPCCADAAVVVFVAFTIINIKYLFCNSI